MGLLDQLFPQSDGGLLDFLKRNASAAVANSPGGLPSDMAQYGGSGMPAYQPGQVQSAPIAPPAPQQQAQQQPVPQMPGAQPAFAPAAQPTGMPSAPSAGQPGFMSFYNNMHGGGGLIGSIMAGMTGQRNDPQGIAQQQQAQQQNMTVRALMAKGVDPQIAAAAVQPGNTELLKQLVDKHFGAPKPPTALGSGYIYNPQTNKVERAYEPEDKIPAGFVKSDDGNMHFIPGGPADPAYLRTAEAQKKDPNAPITLGRGGEIVKNNPDGTVTVLHKNEQNETQPMEPDSLEVLARREIGGDFSGRKNLGRGAQGAADLKAITNKSTEILTHEMGMTPAQAADHLIKKQQEYAAQGQGLNAEARTTGVREANLNLILKATDAAIPAALEASDKVARTGWVPVNKVIQGGQVMASDPDLKAFGMANLQLAEHWARAMNPTGVMREADRDLALHFLSTADSKETYKAAVGQLRTQIERERDAVKASRGMSGLPGSATPAPGAQSATPSAPTVTDGATATNPQTGQRVMFRGGQWVPVQ